MAYKTVVTAKAREKIREILEKVAKEKGDISLAMLVQTLPEVPDRWTLVVSAPWADSKGTRPVISYLSSHLRNLDRNSLSAIDRISVRESTDPAVQDFVKMLDEFLGVDVSEHESGYHMWDSVIAGWNIQEGYIFVADPNANGKTARVKHAQRAIH
ncbi:MAG: hypothetical protein LAO09_08790 [Acidobacteriia bacterium]|nr:hypothetical protein [Terriglobia bacterium]